MAKRAVKAAGRADDKRSTGSAKNPRVVRSPEAKKTAVPPVKTYKRGKPGGGAGRPKGTK